MKKYRRILRYVGQYKGKISLYFFFTLLATFCSVISLGMLAPFVEIIFKSGSSNAQQAALQSNALGFYIKNIIQQVVTTQGKVQALGIICLFIIAATLLKNLFFYVSTYIATPIRGGITQQLRTDMYTKILSLPIGYFSEQRKGDLMSRMTNDIGEIEGSVVGTLEGFIRDPITILVYLIVLIRISPTLSLFLLILLPTTSFIIGRISRSLKKQSHTLSVQSGQGLSIIEETLSGMRVIKAFLAEGIMLKKFASINNSIFHLRNKMSLRQNLASPLAELMGVMVLCTILYFGGRLALNETGNILPAGDLLAYITMFAIIINPAKSLSSSFFNIKRGGAAVERVELLLQSVDSIVEKVDSKKMLSFNNSIEFKNVGFAYGDKTILKNINFTLKKGKTLALVGSSGAGKSTLADLIPRFHDANEGEILIDGINVKDYSIASLRQHMSVVTQEPILFNDTIANNIALGMTNASQQDIEKAATVANAHLFIMQKENGYQANIGDRGSKLSGGERQRLTIARAVLKNPPILILDEATSSLDTESERLVQDAINKMMENRTSIVIAHRLSTVRHADEIIVLKHGEIVERGAHDELIAAKGFYKKLVDMQEVK